MGLRSEEINDETFELIISPHGFEQSKVGCQNLYSFNVRTPRLFAGQSYKRCIATSSEPTNAPTLLTMMDAYGEDFVYDLMERNVLFVNEIAGNKNKLNPYQVSNIASSLVSKFTGAENQRDRLTAAEVLLFFNKLLAGDFGTFYGAVDVLTIGKWANQFLEWISDERDYIENERLDAKRKQESEDMKKTWARPTDEQKRRLEEVRSMFGKKPEYCADEIDQDTIILHNKLFLEQIKQSLNKEHE